MISHVKFKEAELSNREQDGGYQGLGGEWGDVGQRAQASSYKMSKFWGSNARHGNYS